MAEAFSFYSAAHLLFGESVRHRAPECAALAGMKRPCIVSDAFLLGCDFGRELTASLPAAAVFSQVLTNPTIASADACAQFCRAQGCDGLIALGGGSAIDTAKAAAVAFAGGSAADFLDGRGEAKRPVPADCLPVIAIPTTSGTGSEVSQYAVLTDPATRRKDSISSERIYPVYALVDPEVTWQLPAALTVSTGLDVLSHALESITSTISNPLTDLLALEAIRIVFEWLPRCGGPQNTEARSQMAYASSLAGLAMSHCCGTLPHGMGCPLSGHCGVPHGLAVGVLQVPALRLIAVPCRAQLERVARCLDPAFCAQTDTAAADYLIARIGALFDALHCRKDLRDYHITDQQIEAMVPDAMAHGCTGLTPVPVSAGTVAQIYHSLQG